MALIDATKLKALAEDIVPASPGGASSEQVAARDAAVENTENLCTKIYQYFVDNAEVKGIKTDKDAGVRTVETYLAGVGDKGGALNSVTGGPVSGNVNSDTLDTATQSNDGTGLII